MPLVNKEGDLIITSHASKKSMVDLKLFQAHTSVLIPFLAWPVAPFWITVKIAACVALVLVLLERRGWTLKIALKRMRGRLAGNYRYAKTRHSIVRRSKLN